MGVLGFKIQGKGKGKEEGRRAELPHLAVLFSFS